MGADTGYKNSTVGTTRRFYTLAYRDALKLQNGMDGVFLWLSQQQPHTDLPAGFPVLSLLQAAGYSAVEDLDGATESELVALGLTTFQANAALAALPALL